MNKLLNKIGLSIDEASGHMTYHAAFQPFQPSFELIFVRHGETYGNCGQITADGKIDHKLVYAGIKERKQRLYQGQTDTDINQLTIDGKRQALELSFLLEHVLLAKNWTPDVIFHSPLSRAKETGRFFVERNYFNDRYFPLDEIQEMSFGSWDNRRICDLAQDNPCHLLYLDQNALVKHSGINGNGVFQQGESFCEILLRAHRVLTFLDNEYANKKIILFSHSLFGAACAILLGQGQMIEHDQYLAFDGERKNGRSYALPHSKPIFLKTQLG